MKQFKKLSRGKKANNIIGLSSIIAFCVVCIGISSLNDLSNSVQDAPPTFNPANIGTVIVQTMVKAAEETQSSLPPETQTETLMPPSPTLTSTPENIILSTASLAPIIVSNAGTAACIPNLPPETGKVVDVVDGDTIKVLLEDGLIYSVRYIGIDTPENTSTVEYFGAQSSAKNFELVGGQTITLYSDVSNKDQYGRLLRYVFVGETFVNYELVAQGFANAVTYPPDVACSDYFASAQNIAATTGVGLWGATPTLAVVIPIATSGGVAACSCSYNQYNCPDFSSRSEAQACFNYCISIGSGDVHRLDSDNDGAVCESMQ